MSRPVRNVVLPHLDYCLTIWISLRWRGIRLHGTLHRIIVHCLPERQSSPVDTNGTASSHCTRVVGNFPEFCFLFWVSYTHGLYT
jgi:hypothetical protein